MKISGVIDTLLGWHAPVDNPHPSDTIKVGDPDQECTGIGITCFCSTDVVREAVKKGINLIICHEPLFYGDEEQAGIAAEDPVFAAKNQLLADNNIVVWRDHDHLHGPGGPGCEVHTEIDYIYYGIMKELGWEEYARGEETKPLWYEIPKTTGRELAELFLEKFNLTGLRVVGDLNTEVSKVFIAEHVSGRFDAKIIEKAAGADAIIPLEIVDWSLSEYVRDSCMNGMPKVILEMGHFNTEELGMKYMCKWLPDVIGSDIPIHYLQSGDSFGYFLK